MTKPKKAPSHLQIELPEDNTALYERHTISFWAYEEGGGAGRYFLTDAQGSVMPFDYQFDTRHRERTGFTVPGVEGFMTWTQLRQFFAPQDHESQDMPNSDKQADVA